MIRLMRPTGSPPRARELLAILSISLGYFGITPACAGITSPIYSFQLANRDHPRVRGNYTRALQGHLATRGSPPRARELRLMIAEYLWTIGITPACAGITWFFDFTLGRSRDHPRVRGNYLMLLLLKMLKLGSPPRARELPYQWL